MRKQEGENRYHLAPPGFSQVRTQQPSGENPSESYISPYLKHSSCIFHFWSYFVVCQNMFLVPLESRPNSDANTLAATVEFDCRKCFSAVKHQRKTAAFSVGSLKKSKSFFLHSTITQEISTERSQYTRMQ